MSTIYGYCRISRRSQKIERQVENILKSYPKAKLYKEAFTGTKIDGRAELNKLLKTVKEGDTIVFDSVSRLSRKAEDGMQLYFELFDKGVNLIFLKEPYINTEVYKSSVAQTIEKTGNEIADCYIEATNKVIKILATQQIQTAFDQAEKEVNDLRERTSEGLRVAKEKGKRVGTPKGATMNVKKKDPMKKKIKKFCRDFDGSLTDAETITQIRIARNTYYKYKKEIFEELATEESSANLN